MLNAAINARNGQGCVAGALVGTLGGLIGLGGAEFRLPLLVDVFRLQTLEAIILNKAVSLVVVAAGLVGWVQPALLMALLGVLLFISAVKTFRHAH